MKRRQFLKTSALGTIAGGSAFSTSVQAAGTYNEEILVHIFLRGGIDGLNVVVPLGDKDHEYYSIMRPVLAVSDSGTNKAIQLGSTEFGLNPKAAALKDLYDAGHLAIVQAVGTPNPIATRSHFDAEKYIELGTPGLVGTTTGWLHRHFTAMSGTLGQYPDEIFMPIVALRNNPPVSLLGNNSVLTVWSPGGFRLDNAHWRWDVEDPTWPDKGYLQLDMLPEIYALAADQVSHAGNQALTAESILRTSFDKDYTGSGNQSYQGNRIADQLKDVAQMIKLDLGTRTFALDYGGWDSHSSQSSPEVFDYPLEYLCNAIAAFMDDLNSTAGTYADRTTVIVQSEFGRRLYENNSQGTDHGNGNIMLVIGKNVNGGKIYGDWPGLYPGTEDDWVEYANPKNGSTDPELFEGALSTTTDFRRVLSEYLQKRGNHTTASLDQVFPAYSGYSPMGIFSPLAQPDNIIFAGDFED
jgi:uncharacterized protein (DUF1501 family)